MTNVYIKLISAINTKLIKETLITNNDGQSRMCTISGCALGNRIGM